MKKYLTVLSLVVFMFFAFVNLNAAETIDPTGNLTMLQEVENDHINYVARLLESIRLDYHPEYGVVKKEALPCYEKGWDKSNIADYFPEGNVLDGAFKQMTFTGIAMAAHKAKDGKIFYVWHKFNEESAVIMAADVEVDGKSETKIAMAMWHCGNPTPWGTAYFLEGVRISYWLVKHLLDVGAIEIAD